MTRKFTPANVKQDFYNKSSNISNYKNLTIKKNKITSDLKDLFNKNILEIKNLSQQYEKKAIIEHNNIYNAFMSDVYLLDYKTEPKLKTILIKDFKQHKYQGTTKDKTEKDYNDSFNNWINNIFTDRKKDLNFNWFVLNQNEVLYKLLQFHHNNNNKMETVRKHINLLMKLLKLSLGERHEIINKYKTININLSKLYEYQQKNNLLSDLEKTKFIEHEKLLKIRQDLYNDWLEEYENTPLNKYKNKKLRIKNIKSLLLSFYILFPPLRLETFNLKVIKDEKDYKKNEASIYIKDDNNIIIYLNTLKKDHKIIKYNLNDDVIKSFSKNNVNMLINNIIESLSIYPRDILFINSKNEQYTDSGLQKMLSEISEEKKIGVNSLRSSYVTNFFPKINLLKKERIAFLMRSSVQTLEKHYLKNGGVGDEPEAEPEQQQQQLILNEINKNIVETPLKQVKNKIVVDEKLNKKEVESPKNKKLTNDQQEQRHNNKKEYLKGYYENNKDQLLEKAKENDKSKYWMRYVRELRQNFIKWENIKEPTIIKYKLHKQNNKYWSDFDKTY